MRFIACGALLVTALLAVSGSALAQQTTYVERTTNDGQDIRFKDDPLPALSDGPIGAQLSGFHPPRRYDLMRPRKTFVPEMLKSVENM